MNSEAASADETAGMEWWNAMSEDQRAYWLAQANTAIVAEAWAYYKADTPARVGGDEFVVLLEGLPGPETAARVARSLIARLAEPFILGGGNDVRIVLSIGISVFPIDASDPESAMRHGDRSSTKPKPPAEERVDFTTRTLQGEKGEGL